MTCGHIYLVNTTLNLLSMEHYLIYHSIFSWKKETKQTEKKITMGSVDSSGTRHYILFFLMLLLIFNEFNIMSHCYDKSRIGNLYIFWLALCLIWSKHELARFTCSRVNGACCCLSDSLNSHTPLFGWRKTVSKFAFLYNAPVSCLANKIVWCKKRMKTTLHASNEMHKKQGHDIVTL